MTWFKMGGVVNTAAILILGTEWSSWCWWLMSRWRWGYQQITEKDDNANNGDTYNDNNEYEDNDNCDDNNDKLWWWRFTTMTEWIKFVKVS